MLIRKGSFKGKVASSNLTLISYNCSNNWFCSKMTLPKVAFTGSTYIGQVLRRATAGTGKKLSLELGGKSPVIIFDDCDLDSAVEGVVDAIWFNQGQVCSAGSRILIQETVFEKVVNKIKHRLQSFRVGNSLDKVKSQISD